MFDQPNQLQQYACKHEIITNRINSVIDHKAHDSVTTVKLEGNALEWGM